MQLKNLSKQLHLDVPLRNCTRIRDHHYCVNNYPLAECIICQIVDIILAIFYDDMVQFYQFIVSVTHTAFVLPINYQGAFTYEHTGI